MYTAFFGLKEIPFSISPNPHFLFMSDRHREALSHLTYALGDQGGFVLLTGEVGTGKTTISRCLMEQLPDNVQRAFILNPTLSSQELLATICDELKIKYNANKATLKTLTDAIQKKLLHNHNNGINTLLIIDEAQHLRPEVLEQLRLLTNLETDIKKLLKVILIGQPELQVLLKRRDLRQLAQRITARYHLLPLNKEDVAQYVKYRLSVAECNRDIFKANALIMIHQLTQGIPRLINLLCDRALMHAYNNNDSIVTKLCIINASEEALGEKYCPSPWWRSKPVNISLMIAALLVTFSLGFLWSQGGLSIVTPHSLAKSDLDEHVIDNQEDTTTVDSPVAAITQVVAALTFPKEAIEKVELVKATKKKVAPTKTESTKKKESNYKINTVEGVSDDLLARFQSALNETDIDKNTANKKSENILSTSNSTDEKIGTPAWLSEKLKGVDFQIHIYASDGEGWIRVNGKDVYEGGKISNQFTVTEILPQSLVLTYQGESFNVPALSSW